MKLYTGTGDGGKTSLFSGERISKNNARIEAYGVVDELNSLVGSLAAALPESSLKNEVKAELRTIQSDLFHVGAWLATTPDSSSADLLTPITEKQGQWLEERIDEMELKLEPLTAFILPGGHQSAGWAHLARTVCRRAERRAVSLLAELENPSEAMEHILVYLNRLSDYFFIFARFCNHLAGEKDDIWHG